jgi:hypothetical protein
MRLALIYFLFFGYISAFAQNAKAEYLRGKPVSYYLEHKKVLQYSKDIYTGKLQPADSDPAFRTMDSMFTVNDSLRPFYFLVTTRIMYKSDGALSEMVSTNAEKFVRTRSKDFAQYFTNEKIFTSADLEQWTSYVAAELFIGNEGNEEAAFKEFSNTAKSNCTACSSYLQKKLAEYLSLVNKNLQAMKNGTYKPN